MTAVVAVLGVVVVVLAVLVISLLRSHAEILRTLHDMGADLDPTRPGVSGQPGVPDASTAGPGGALVGPPGTGGVDRPAPDVSGPTPRGDAVALGLSDPAGPPTLVAFLSSGCMTCHGFWDAFGESGAHDLPDGMQLAVVTKGDEAESPAAVAKLAARHLTVVMSSDAWEDYDVPLAPYFVMVERGRVAGEGAAATWDQVATLIGRAAADQREATRSRREIIGARREVDR